MHVHHPDVLTDPASEDELGKLRRELQDTQAELENARALIVVQARALSIDPHDPPPAQLVEAWRRGEHEMTPVTVQIDGIDWDLIVMGRNGPHPDPVADAHAWTWLRRALRQDGR